METELQPAGNPAPDKRSTMAIFLITAIWIIALQYLWPSPNRAAPGPGKGEPTKLEPGPGNPKDPVPGPANPGGPDHPQPGPGPGPGPGPVPVPAPAPSAWVEPPLETTVLANDFLRVTLTNRGAAVQSVELLKYKGDGGKPTLSLLSELEEDHPSFRLRSEDKTLPLDTVRWRKEPAQTPDQVKYRYDAPNGITYRKIFRLRPEDRGKPEYRYLLGLSVLLENGPGAAQLLKLEVEGPAGVNVESEALRPNLQGQLGASEDGQRWHVIEPTPVSAVADKEKTVAGSKAAWAAVSSKYFAAVLRPDPTSDVPVAEYAFRVLTETRLLKEALAGNPKPSEADREKAEKAAKANLLAIARLKECGVSPNETKIVKFEMYCGPKHDEDLLLHESKGFDKLLDYGWAGWISRLLLWVLGGLHGLVGNFGWAIIGLTFVVKFSLFPLTKKSQVAMYKMQKLQPEFMKLKEKYAEDKQKMNMEVMKLYQENGVNPLGGCFPILFQIPVFIGLYNALNYSIDLRQQGWLGWVKDLSQPDVLWKMPFSILGTSELHLLPLVMTATWFVQSLTQPKSPDPQVQSQQKMFMVMPIFFGLMMYSMPAGLILYWLTSTMLAIGEQQLIKKVILPRAA